MWRYKLKNGKFKYVESYKDKMTGRLKEVSVTITSCGRKKGDDLAAKEKLDRKIRDKQTDLKDKDITFEYLCQKRLEWQRLHLKNQTATSSEHHLRTLIRLLGADTIVSRLNAPYVSEKLASEVPVTYNERLKNFKSCIRWAYKNDLVKDISYLGKLERMKDRPVREKDKYKYLEHDEIIELLNNMTVLRWRLLTQFLLLTGLRIGEAMALKNDDVDLDSREIHVTKTCSIHEHEISTTKTLTSCRDVWMQDELLKCCRDIKHMVNVEKMQLGYRSDIFIPNTEGGYFQYFAYNKYLKENTQKVLGRRLTPHALRHTHVAMLAEAGINLETISRRLGHADSKITKEVYYHVTDKMRDREREKLKGFKILA